MRRDIDPYMLSSPQVYLLRMAIFLVIAGFVVLILGPQIRIAYNANPALNTLIFLVLGIGIVMALRQVWRLRPEIAWVNSYRLGDPGLEVRAPPPLIAPMATLLGDRAGEGGISPELRGSILDSLGMRLDETREILRYLTGLLIFLGLLGTFWGLSETVGSVSQVINSLQVGGNDVGVLFEDLKSGLAAPLGGMGTAFASSLFGLAGSLVLGFLDLQCGQAQNRFYTELEDWLTTLTESSSGLALAPAPTVVDFDLTPLTQQIDRLAQVVAAMPAATATRSGGGGTQSRAATAAMADLAEGIQGLVQHMRSEQQVVREWIEGQAERQNDMQRLLEAIAHRDGDPDGERTRRLSRQGG